MNADERRSKASHGSHGFSRMTLEQLDNSLPNGFHDSYIDRMSIDYIERKAVWDVQILVGLPDDGPDTRDAYRTARMSFAGVQYICFEPPCPNYGYSTDSVEIDGLYDSKEYFNVDLMKDLPGSVFARSFYSRSWNSFLHIAAESVQFEW